MCTKQVSAQLALEASKQCSHTPHQPQSFLGISLLPRRAAYEDKSAAKVVASTRAPGVSLWTMLIRSLDPFVP